MEFTFLLYDTPVTTGTFTYDPTVHTTGDVTVMDGQASGPDAIFHDNAGLDFTDPNVDNAAEDPDGVNDQTVVDNDLDPAANGLSIQSVAHVIITGDDGSEFVGFLVFSNDSGVNDPWGSGDPVFAVTQALTPGVEYTFSVPVAGQQGSGGIFGNGSVPYSALATEQIMVPCFCAGTMIETDQGDVAVEDLAEGTLVRTADHGMQPIRWIGSSKRRAIGDVAPILIRKGALGNTRDLRVSPQHRMLLEGWQAELLFEESQVLATAKSLINDHSIIRVEGGEVEYFHILFDTHQIIWAEGAPTESFHPGEQGWKSLAPSTRNEILELFPEFADGAFESYGSSARVSLKHKEGALLGSEMIQVTGNA